MAENSKRIAVTGGHGKVGKFLVPYLKEKGDTVFITDHTEPTDPDELAMVTDLTDFGQALDARLWNMWTYIDNRDAAHAIECAIRHDVRGKDAFLITNDETVMRTPTADLLDRHFPEAERRKAFTGNEVVLSNAKAKQVLGFQPVHRWTDKV